MITIANAGIGNFLSVANMFKYLEIDVEIRSTPGHLNSISHLILPGVGAFDAGMNALETSGWRGAIEKLSVNTQVLGICLGMHLLTNGSEEGSKPGLSIIDAGCRRFNESQVKVPHIGWNSVSMLRENSLLSQDDSHRFYFTHSYYVEMQNPLHVLSVTKYGDEFTSVYKKDNFYGVQFHPEKSHKFGMKFFSNFARL